ncbi:MAG TPA: toprim domain-containing protein [Abditibacterium sp.]|jgi:hypothetical protein
MASPQPKLSLRDLESIDPRASGLAVGQGGGEQRFLCPLCGQGKAKDAAHRSLSLNPQSGLWRCHRCGESGKVSEAWEERPPTERRQRAQIALSRVFAAPTTTPVEERAQPKDTSWKNALHGLQPLGETRSARYLEGRGLSVETATLSGARFSPSFMGRPAVVFPLRDQSGALVGAQGRYIDGRDTPKARTLGDKRASLFSTRDALDAHLPALIVTEAPLDALSLARAGYPAVALCGTQAPTWLHRAGAFRRVLLAFDADDAGDVAAENLTPLLASFGARCERLRPEGAKDWNEILQASGRDALADFLAARVLID